MSNKVILNSTPLISATILFSSADMLIFEAFVGTLHNSLCNVLFRFRLIQIVIKTKLHVQKSGVWRLRVRFFISSHSWFDIGIPFILAMFLRNTTKKYLRCTVLAHPICSKTIPLSLINTESSWSSWSTKALASWLYVMVRIESDRIIIINITHNFLESVFSFAFCNFGITR